MILEVARLLLVVALVVLVPGFLLVAAAFPPSRSTLTPIERSYLVIVGGLLLVALVGVALGFLPGPGFFSTMATGFPHVEFALVGVSALLLWIGIQRGAFPGLAARFKAMRQTP